MAAQIIDLGNYKARRFFADLRSRKDTRATRIFWASVGKTAKPEEPNALLDLSRTLKEISQADYQAAVEEDSKDLFDDKS